MIIIGPHFILLFLNWAYIKKLFWVWFHLLSYSSFPSPRQNNCQTIGVIIDYHLASLHEDALSSVYVTAWKICILAMSLFVHKK